MDKIEKQLIQLVEKLKGKSCYDNLKNISKGTSKDKIQEAIGISSLLTHSIIELKEDPDYKILTSNLFEKLGMLLYNL